MAKNLQKIRIGFMPLTDCASVVIAAERGFDRKHGVKFVLSRETSWAGVRDKLASGVLDAAHVLYGLVYGMQLGIGCRQVSMAVLMNLSRNGQAITLSRALANAGAADGAALARVIWGGQRPYTFAQTFPTGNHAMLLYYWLAAYGVHPFVDVRALTIPPAQMVANLRAGLIDGFCAGEPWGARALKDGIGITAATSGQVWPDHPGKVLGTTAAFADQHPDACRAAIAALLEAGAWLDASPPNRRHAAQVLSGGAFLNTGMDVIEPRLLGNDDNGAGEGWQNPCGLQFFQDGTVNFPYLSDAMWFMTQHRRWGLLVQDPDYLGTASAVNRIALYSEAAGLTGTSLPVSSMRASTLMDGMVWDGNDPAAYARAFSIHRRG